MTKYIDMPPIWLLAFIALAWAQARFLPLGLSLGYTWSGALAGLLIGGGVILIILAVMEMRRHRTTIIPRQTASRLVQSGIFKRSRNPIYLGDALILLGMILRFDAVLSLMLVPIFVWIIERRFILPEEKHLRQTFRMEFAQYERKVRRWV